MAKKKEKKEDESQDNLEDPIRDPKVVNAEAENFYNADDGWIPCTLEELKVYNEQGLTLGYDGKRGLIKLKK